MSPAKLLKGPLKIIAAAKPTLMSTLLLKRLLMPRLLQLLILNLKLLPLLLSILLSGRRSQNKC